MDFSFATSNKRSYLQILQYVILTCIILYFGREFFIPLTFALVLSLVLYPSCVWMERKGIGRMTAIIINVTLLLILFLGLFALLVNQLVSFLQEWPTLRTKFAASVKDLSAFLSSSYTISEEVQRQWLSQITSLSGSNILGLLRNAIAASAVSAVLIILVPVYVVLILYHRQQWIQVLSRLFPSIKHEDMLEMLTLSIKGYYDFVKGVALVYLIVGVLNSIGFLLLQIPHAILFGFIAAVLTFIPYVGIMIGGLLPLAMAWITYDSVWYPVGVVIVLSVVQYLEANVIFPLTVSKGLNVNMLVVLSAIVVGGLLWGVSGMILFVPATGILKLIADHNPHLETLSLLLGTGHAVHQASIQPGKESASTK